MEFPTDRPQVRPESENRERFKRLAEARTNAVLDRIRVLAHCGNKYAYDYTDAEVERIFMTIENELQRAKQKFSAEQRTTFKLDES